MSEPMTDPTYASDATSMGEQEDALSAEGYDGQFIALADAQVRCTHCNVVTPASDLAANAILRAEGASDPDDMTATIALQCPACDTKGTLVVHFGAEASIEDQDVFRALGDNRDAASGGQEPA